MGKFFGIMVFSMALMIIMCSNTAAQSYGNGGNFNNGSGYSNGYGGTYRMPTRMPVANPGFNLVCTNVGGCFNNYGSGQYNIGGSSGNFNNGSGYSNGNGHGYGRGMGYMRMPVRSINLVCNSTGGCFNNYGSGQYNIATSGGNFNNGSGYSNGRRRH